MEANQNTSAPVAPDQARRRRLLISLTSAAALVAVAYGAYWGLYGRHFESTDDAYVAGNLIQLTPQVAGTVVSINADDTDRVEAGQAVIKLDPADTKVAMDQAESQLAQAVRDVRGLYANTSQLEANVAQRQADLDKAQADLGRRDKLGTSGAISGEELAHAKDQVKSAAAALAAAQEALAANQAQVDNTKIATHPTVAKAAAHFEEAYLAYHRTLIPAPVTGQVARRAVQVGQRVSPGTPLLAIVPLEHLWVDANFKEVQLRQMRIGQPVTLSADIYGGKVSYHGKVVGLGAGTGAAFALLPAQNATGNWIKVVQRVPVRVSLDAKELQQHPLRVGLSMEAEVDTRDDSGAPVAQAPRSESAYATSVYDTQLKEADARIQAIIAANVGAKPKAKTPGAQPHA